MITTGKKNQFNLVVVAIVLALKENTFSFSLKSVFFFLEHQMWNLNDLNKSQPYFLSIVIPYKLRVHSVSSSKFLGFSW